MLLLFFMATMTLFSLLLLTTDYSSECYCCSWWCWCFCFSFAINTTMLTLTLPKTRERERATQLTTHFSHQHCKAIKLWRSMLELQHARMRIFLNKQITFFVNHSSIPTHPYIAITHRTATWKLRRAYEFLACMVPAFHFISLADFSFSLRPKRFWL